MREEYDTVLSQFNYLTTDVYQKKGETLLAELKEQIKQDGVCQRKLTEILVVN